MAQIDNTIVRIEDAIKDVTLGGGVSLREADVIDGYGSQEEQLAARQEGEIYVWQRISDEDIANHPSALCFMDEEGLRYHLPAYMRYTLRWYRESESLCTDSTIWGHS